MRGFDGFGSIDFARLVLQQYHFPVPDGLFEPAALENAHVLELGYVRYRLLDSQRLLVSLTISLYHAAPEQASSASS